MTRAARSGSTRALTGRGNGAPYLTPLVLEYSVGRTENGALNIRTAIPEFDLLVP